MLVARARFGLERAEVEGLQREQAELAGCGSAGRNFSSPIDSKVAVEILRAEAAAPAAAGRLARLEPRLAALDC